MREKYVLISGNIVENYTREEWFNKEAILYIPSEGQRKLDNAYFIPFDRAISIEDYKVNPPPIKYK
jgi:hypothetical protein